MVFENLLELGNFLFILVILGYVFEFFYQAGYYRFRYKPLNTTERLLHRSSIGIFFIILSVLIYAQLVTSKSLKIPQNVNNVTLPDIVGVYAYLFGGFSYLLLFGIFLSFVSGYFTSIIPKKHVMIKTKEAQPLEVREIYSITDDFIFYIDVDGKWGSIRKSDIESMKQVNSELLTWLKNIL